MEKFRQVIALTVWIIPLFFTNTAKSGVTGSGSFIITRLNNGEPIITEVMFDALGATSSEGTSIAGASVIRVPEWIAPENRADPNAVYYMYFAHHGGNYIRLAWAEDLEGPWHLYQTGAGVSVGDRGVLDLGGDDKINIGNGIEIRGHVASPDVHADDDNQRIIMYFHGPTYVNNSYKDQESFVATSEFGLDFDGRIEPVILGYFYFRVFKYNGELYVVGKRGYLYKAPDPNDPWTPPPGFDFWDYLWTERPDKPFQDDIDNDSNLVDGQYLRHNALRLVGDTLQVFYTRVRDAPERIMMSTIDLSVGDYDVWDPTYPPEEILQAELDWEGGNIPPSPSSGGTAPENVNQLRDPCIFKDIDGMLYLFYSGRGEDAIGIARLHPVAAGDFEPDGDVDYRDLAVLAGEWLYESGELIANLDNNDGVSFTDYAILAGNWTGP
ncbi:MAG: hypothetical protein OEW48_11740 [Phycisphaerae bacterium]|nr:hypothetical protein [Phycisphaerae bacterium]